MQRRDEDVEKYKEKIKKLKSRKGLSIEMATKLCSNCGKEYKDSENFAWKCRTHWSEFGGELWWCCGKRGLNAPGCKMQKHVCADDDGEGSDDEDTK